jgi:hypothetical protein
LLRRLLVSQHALDPRDRNSGLESIPAFQKCSIRAKVLCTGENPRLSEVLDPRDKVLCTGENPRFSEVLDPRDKVLCTGENHVCRAHDRD